LLYDAQGLGQGEVADPSAEIGVHRLDPVTHPFAATAPRETTKGHLDFPHRVRSNANLRRFPGKEGESQDVAAKGAVNRTLLPVYAKLEPGLDPVRHARQHPLPRPVGPDVAVAVVRVADGAVSSLCQFRSQIIQDDGR